MRRIVHYLGMVTGVMLTSLSFSGVAEDREPVVIASDLWCPFTCEPGGDMQGYLVDVTSRALALAGFESRYIATGFERAARNVREGSWDILIATNPDFTPDIPLSRFPVLQSRTAFFARGKDIGAVSGPEDMGDLVLGVVAGYSYSDEMNDWIRDNPDQVIAVRSVSPYERLIHMLDNGRIDIILEDRHAIEWWAREVGFLEEMRVVGHGDPATLYNGFSPVAEGAAELQKAFETYLPQVVKSKYHDDLLKKYNLPAEVSLNALIAKDGKGRGGIRADDL